MKPSTSGRTLLLVDTALLLMISAHPVESLIVYVLPFWHGINKFPNLQWLWLAYGVLAGTIGFFNRSFHGNHLGMVLIALIIACFASGQYELHHHRRALPYENV